ncbi:MAG: HNH endonuclease [Acidimicrobiales bacterium]|nr:HNH endonuclease [Acidimicrobiales bacterium]RZV46417.1 MAG: HNH endonuclease [Acidimicrobiales bacterium]
MAVTNLFSSGDAQHRRVIDELNAALDGASSLGLLSLDLEELEAFAVDVIKIRDRATALAASVVAEAEAAALAPRSGVKSLNAHLASKLRTPTSHVAPLRTAGLWLNRFPLFMDAALRGELTDAHIRDLRQCDNPRTHQLMVRDQQVLLDSATTLEFTGFQSALAYWLFHADPDGALSKQRQETYGVTVRTKRNGDVEIKATLDPISGEAFLTAVEHEAQKLFRNERDAGHGEGVMTHRKRRMIAMMRLLSKGFERKDGTHPVPLVNIVMSETVLEDLINRMLGEPGADFDPFNLPIDYNDVDRRCETIRGTPIHPRRAWPAVLYGRLRRQILDAKSRTIDLGHDVRLFTAAQKNALLVETRGQCAETGCDAPFAWLHADHKIAYTNGGPTNMNNGRIICGPDNHRKGDR